MVTNGNCLLWFRNDLRIDDNPALQAAIENGCTNAVYVRTPKQWQQHEMAEIKIDFIDRHLAMLRHYLAQLNIELWVLTVDDYHQQAQTIIQFCQQHQLTGVYANSELELNETKRDAQLISQGIPLYLYEADTMLPKGTVTNKDGEMYKVFTPYKKAWLNSVFSGYTISLPAPWQSPAPYQEQLDSEVSSSAKWPLADVKVQELTQHFLNHKLDSYAELRDFPSVKGTSGLSPYLAIGAISVRRVFVLVQQHYQFHELGIEQLQQDVWLSELIWREFYRNLLFHYPNLIKGENFKPQYDNLPWPNHLYLLEKWREGKTGFPIIDAAMRQLQQTGWMHNRLRMIVASFLTKNCLVNWRYGESYFMQHLIDGDFAANNGGWQWSAGTGCDAQPYFRVFNPVSQSKKFDPDGAFIRKYLPELANVPDKHIHQPNIYLESMGQQDKYWPEIVDLKSSRQQAIEFYGQAKATTES